MPATPHCPAAIYMDGPRGDSVICGVLANDRDKEDQYSDQEMEGSVVFSERGDPATFFGYCTCSWYTDCRIWQAEKKRIADRRPRLEEPDPNAQPAEFLDLAAGA